MKSYDYIFTGTGAAAWSVLLRMLDAGLVNNKKILLLDRSPKVHNDRTWCFWEEQAGYFESIIHHQWDTLSFHSDTLSRNLDLDAYRYKMIRSVDFYAHAQERISGLDNIEQRYGQVEWVEEANGMTLLLDGAPIDTTGALVFNSIPPPTKADPAAIDLLQHFKGWLIETPTPVFDPGKATLMDFRVSQKEGATFIYVLPVSPTKALVEYTLFTEQLLSNEQYEQGLKDYIAQYLSLENYSIVEEEFGIIPMTTRRFPFFHKGVYHLGTAGGQTKASTGYTFQFIQKQAEYMVSCLTQRQSLPHTWPAPARFHFYDKVLLRLLQKKQPTGSAIFTRLFERNKASAIFRFLDNETSLAQEIRIMSTLQIGAFFRAAVRM